MRGKFPMAGAETTRERRVSREEHRLWHTVMRDAKPLRSKSGAADREVAAQESHRVPKKPHSANKVVASSCREAPARTLPELVHGHAPGLEKSTARRMRKGQMTIDARMDLHGHTQEQAHRALNAFISTSYADGRRCVLVITGKGARGDAGPGVLRRAVPHWLNATPNRERVLAFSFAARQHGGEGALYVLLRRKRG